jgi:hypothetical protein
MAHGARVMAEEHLGLVDSAFASKAFDLIEDNAEVIAHLAPQGLIGLTGTYWQLGEVKARESYIRNHASIEEVFAAQDAAHRATVEEKASSVWSDIVPIISAIAPVLPKLLPFLIAVL